MKTILQKKSLKDGYYYSGYILQRYCVVSANQPLVVGQWDSKENCFWFWDYDGNRKTKQSLPTLSDIDTMDEISEGFIPLKEIFPKEEEVIS